MLNFSFRVGLVFDWCGAEFRIERLQPNDDVLIERSEDGALLVKQRSELLAAYANSELGVKNPNPGPAQARTFSRPLQDLSAAAQREIVRRKHYIDHVAQEGRPIFTTEYLRPILQKAAEFIEDPKPPGASTFWRWWRSYHLANDARALVPKNRLTGRSRPRQPPEIMNMLGEAIVEAYSRTPQADSLLIHEALDRRVEAENRRRLAHEQLQMPHLRTVQRLIRRAPAYEISVLREGKTAADRKFRLVKGSTVTTRVLERVEVDHTPLDVFIVDDATMLPLGRPLLTALIDHYSRMLVGYFIGFGPPSTAAVMAGLRHAMLPKEPVATPIPDLKIDNSWPCWGRPAVLVLDNGMEFHSDDLESVALDLGIHLQYCPKHEPRFKGVVERFLKTVNYKFAHQLPGTSFAKMHLRGDYDSTRHALLTFGEFKQLFEKWLLDIYGQELHRGIQSPPAARWAEGAQRSMLQLPPDRSALERRIGLVEQRSLQHYGVDLNNIRYCGDELGRLLYQHGPGVQVRIVYDPQDVGHIQVWGPGDDDPVTVHARLYDSYKGLTLFQARLIHERLREDGRSLQDTEAIRRAKADLSEAVLKLLGSRKQRDRQRSAAIRGISDQLPSGSLEKPLKQSRRRSRAASAPEAPQPPKADTTALPEPMPLPLPSFQMKRDAKDGS
jgi:putative transposase